MVFSGGHRVRAKATDAVTLIQRLNLPAQEQIRMSDSGTMLAESWVDIETENEGVLLVNPAQVAYVRDVPDVEPVLDQAL